MILANFNRSLGPLGLLILLSSTGCSQQSTSHIAIDKDGAVVAHKLDKDGAKIAIAKKSPTEKKEVTKVAVAEKAAVPKKQSVPKSESDSIWKRMFSLYALPKVKNARIDEEIEKFLKHPSHLVRVQKRAEPYLRLVMDEIEAKKLPGEFALLPIVESAYRANVSSPASAAGLWQFIPSTGRSFGLKQNWWYDGRRDVYSSTQAATRYLKQLNKRVDGDWFLALASYNVGLGNVRKAIRKNEQEELETDYWSLDLPKETMQYVPKLLALAEIFANAEKYKLPLQPIPDKPFFKVVNIKSQLDLKKAARLAGMSFKDMFILNPAFKRVVTAPDGPHRLLVKTDKARTFTRKLAKLPVHKRFKWVEHKIKEGEDLKTIAKKHNTSIKDLLRVNDLKKQQIKNIKVGKVLKIPPAPIKELTKGKA